MSAPDSQYQEESTVPGREKNEANNLAEILTEASKWNLLDELETHAIVFNKTSLDALDKMKSLKTLSISSPLGSEIDLAQRKEFLWRLTHIWLSHLSAADTLSALSGSPNLDYLMLLDTKVTGQDLAALSRCKNLHYFFFKTDSIDDSMIDSISTFKSLKAIYFQDSPISPWQLKRLLKNLPAIKIIDLSKRSKAHLDQELMDNPKIRQVIEKSKAPEFE